MNSSPDRFPHDKDIVGVALNGGRVRISSILVTWVSVLSFNIAVTLTFGPSVAELAAEPGASQELVASFLLVIVCSVSGVDGLCPLAPTGVPAGVGASS